MQSLSNLRHSAFSEFRHQSSRRCWGQASFSGYLQVAWRRRLNPVYYACPTSTLLPRKLQHNGQALLLLLIIPHQFWAVVLANQPLLCVSLIAHWIDQRWKDGQLFGPLPHQSLWLLAFCYFLSAGVLLNATLVCSLAQRRALPNNSSSSLCLPGCLLCLPNGSFHSMAELKSARLFWSSIRKKLWMVPGTFFLESPLCFQAS